MCIRSKPLYCIPVFWLVLMPTVQLHKLQCIVGYSTYRVLSRKKLTIYIIQNTMYLQTMRSDKTFIFNGWIPRAWKLYLIYFPMVFILAHPKDINSDIPWLWVHYSSWLWQLFFSCINTITPRTFRLSQLTVWTGPKLLKYCCRFCGKVPFGKPRTNKVFSASSSCFLCCAANRKCFLPFSCDFIVASDGNGHMVLH